MFGTDSFDTIENSTEAKAAVQYLARNELKFSQQLASEGLGYDEIKAEIKQVWLSLLKVCSKFKYSDFIIASKKTTYGLK